MKSGLLMRIMLLTVAVLAAGCSDGGQSEGDSSMARNIILFIGDGMGAEQRKAARWALGGEGGALSMDDMSSAGELITFSASSAVTDSAAAATAMATGVKTANGVVALDVELFPVTTILEEAKFQGRSVGLVTTTQLSHATPAAFIAHVEERNLMTDITVQMVETGPEVLLGGGEDAFIPVTETGCHPEAGEREDGRNLITEALEDGYAYVCDADAFDSIDTSSTAKLIGIFSDEGMPRPFSPSLAEMTELAIDILSKNENGFFLMVEAGQIDWACHGNDAENTLADTIGLDAAVAAAKRFAAGSGDTLIIVTADHETGGMTVSWQASGKAGEDGPFATPDGGAFYVNWATTGHTAARVPVTSMGPMSDWLAGVNDNTYLYDAMNAAFSGAGS